MQIYFHSRLCSYVCIKGANIIGGQCIYIYVYTVYMLSPCLLCLCPISVAHVHLFSSAVSAVCHFPAFQFPATVLEILDIALTTS